MSNHRRGHEIEGVGDMVDHISKLPDFILHDHILSLMRTQEVVKTSILSKRWKNLSASVPNIELNDYSLFYAAVINDASYPPKVTSFMNFAERVLRLRGGLNLKKFNLIFYHFSAFSQMHSWIYDAITHNIQDLELRLYAQDPHVIPWSILDKTSLVSLKIYILSLVEIPSHIAFPCLKTLLLSSIALLSGDSIQELLSGSPVLEELVLIGSKWKEDTSLIVISSSTLKSLKILHPFGFESININAPNLMCFDYTGYLSNKIFLNDTSSLVKVCIHTYTCDDKMEKEAACRVVYLTKDLTYIMSLRVSNCTIEGFNCRLVEDISNWHSIPICMKNCLKRLTLKNFHGNDSEIRFLKCLLKYACVLERMDIWWSKKNVRELKRKIEVMKELEKIKRSSSNCVIKFS